MRSPAQTQSEGGFAELGGPVPQTPWDLARFCHPMFAIQNQNRRQPMLIPGMVWPRKSALGSHPCVCLILRSGPDQSNPKRNPSRTVTRIENACRIAGWQGITILS